MGPQSHVSVVDYYTDIVLPALAERLDAAFPEFGWRRDARGWIATNEETTHRVLGVRAERVVAHGPAPRGFLVHGGEATLWTAYVSGGGTPHGAEFVRVVTDLAARAGVDTAPMERAAPRDRRAGLLEEFFELARRELSSDRGADARAYLERRSFPLEAIATSGLGVVPAPDATRRDLSRAGYRDTEIRAAGILADSRWPGRLCGAWRNEWGSIGTLWSRALADGVAAETRYLYLRGTSRTNLPPYGLARSVRELVLVEGFFDYHQLLAREVKNVAALGGTSTSPHLFERLSQRGVHEVTLCLDNDEAGRKATARAVEHASRAATSPDIYVVCPEGAGTKDPDALVRSDGIDAWRKLLTRRECGIVWRAKEIVMGLAFEAPSSDRRAALRRAGSWLGTLPPRLALEQEDAVGVVAKLCGYSPEATQRAFRARFFRDSMTVGDHELARDRLARSVESRVEL
jgi:hypothetical protein